jgi:CDP-4-dehydro-6-deoxyglucose reductase, E3
MATDNLVSPLMPILTFDTIVKNIKVWSPTVTAFDFRMPEGKPLDFVAGQFIMINAPRDGKMIRKPYSIASAPSERNTLQLIITRVDNGFMSNHLHSLKVGDHLPMDGPYGKFTIKEPFQDLIFVATGTGVAPFRSQILDLLARGVTGHIWLLFGVRYEDQILYEPEWKELAAKHKNFHFLPTISRPRPGKWDGERGYVQNLLKKQITDPKGKDIYICGIVPMVEDVQKAAAEMGFEKSQIHFEKYT